MTQTNALLIVDREGVVSSLSLSQQLVTRGGFGNYLLLVIIVFAISIALSGIHYNGLILGWFLMPIVWLLEGNRTGELNFKPTTTRVLDSRQMVH